MKYKNNQIVYETGDWVTIDNLRGDNIGTVGATFCVGAVDDIWVHQDKSKSFPIPGNCWYSWNLRPAIQKEIDATIERNNPKIKIPVKQGSVAVELTKKRILKTW